MGQTIKRKFYNITSVRFLNFMTGSKCLYYSLKNTKKLNYSNSFHDITEPKNVNVIAHMNLPDLRHLLSFFVSVCPAVPMAHDQVHAVLRPDERVIINYFDTTHPVWTVISGYFFKTAFHGFILQKRHTPLRNCQDDVHSIYIQNICRAANIYFPTFNYWILNYILLLTINFLTRSPTNIKSPLVFM